MRVFCSQCGTANEGTPGSKVMCVRCTEIFEVPATPGAAAPGPAPTDTPPPAPDPLAPDPLVPDAVLPPRTAYRGQPTSMDFSGPPATEPLAIVSLVAGILCCVPLGSTTALVTGFMALGRIDANPQGRTGKGLAIAGIALGGVSWLVALLWLAFAVFFQHI